MKAQIVVITLLALLAPVFVPAPALAGPDSASPGQHSLVLEVRNTLSAAQQKTFRDFWGGCAPFDPFPGGLRGDVGFGNTELPSGTRCGAVNLQLALDFDDSPLRRIPEARIDTVTLTYDESAAPLCPLVAYQNTPCWSSGGGSAENKPNGCVEIKLPTVDWVNSPPPGLIPYSTNPKPATTRLNARAWDVTEPFRWQFNPINRPLIPPGEQAPPSGYGFLMTGAIYIDQLDGNDNTVCISQVSNINLQVTYTVITGGHSHPVN